MTPLYWIEKIRLDCRPLTESQRQAVAGAMSIPWGTFAKIVTGQTKWPDSSTLQKVAEHYLRLDPPPPAKRGRPPNVVS